MKLPVQLFLLFVHLCFTAFIAAQPPAMKGYIIQIRADSTSYKGVLTNLTDSSLSLFRANHQDRIQIHAETIRVIKVKRPFLRTVLADMLAGTLLLSSVYFSNTSSENFYRKDLLVSMASGAAVGFVIGSMQSVFIKIRIPVNKNRQTFEKKRDRLFKYISY